MLQGGSLPDLKKKGGGADGNVFVSGFDSVCDIFIVNDIRNFVFGLAVATVYGFCKSRKQKFVMSFTIITLLAYIDRNNKRK